MCVCSIRWMEKRFTFISVLIFCDIVCLPSQHCLLKRSNMDVWICKNNKISSIIEITDCFDFCKFEWGFQRIFFSNSYALLIDHWNLPAIFAPSMMWANEFTILEHCRLYDKMIKAKSPLTRSLKYNTPWIPHRKWKIEPVLPCERSAAVLIQAVNFTLFTCIRHFI